jgi:NADPH2:quinone reductase
MMRIGTLSHMKAVIVTRLGGPEVLKVQEVAEPTPSANQQLVRVQAGGVNFADTLTMHGGYPGAPKPPLTAGREFCGIEKDSNHRVMGYVQWGAFAEVVVASSNLLWPVPESWSAEEGAAFPVNYFTAYLAFWKAGLIPQHPTPGQVEPVHTQPRLLIHAAAGGVGTAAVLIGKLLGVEMYGTSSSDDKLARVKAVGLQHGINYKQVDYEDAIKNLTNGEGVDAVFEMLGGEHTAKSTRCLRDFGRVIVYGNATGQRAEFDTRALYVKGASIHGLWLTYLSANQALMQEAWKRLSSWAEEGHLRPVIGTVLPITQAAQAYALLLERKNFGKVVLKVN